MTYKKALQDSMKKLSLDPRVRFLGYNVKYGSKAYGTLNEIPENQLIETPLAENLMMGLAIGMSIEGYVPVVFFERHDFLLNAFDGIINHLDKIEKMSFGEYKTPVIIRTVVGNKTPIDPGIQHTQNYTDSIKKMVSFPVVELNNKEDVIKHYDLALKQNSPILFVEKKDLFDKIN